MSVAAGLNRRITQLAVGRHLPRRTVRVRLTLLYGCLFLVSGAALMAITYALLVNAGFVFTLQNSSGPGPVGALRVQSPATGSSAAPVAGLRTHPSAATLAHWRGVAQCMRNNGLPRFPDPTTRFAPRSVPSAEVELSNHDGALFAIPTTTQHSPQFRAAAVGCGYVDHYQSEVWAQEGRQRTNARQRLLVESGIALAGMSLLSLGLGWLMAGRVLQPLEDSYRAQRQFVANASHELRAPLTRQRALIEVALANPEPSVGSLRSTHERVLASEQQLEQLIDALLALTRGQAGLERREHLDLAAIASQDLLAREPELERLDLAIHATLDASPTEGDPRLLERLIANLIDNAVRHNASGGRVEITTGTRDQHSFLAITNTGPTIPPAKIQRLLQPFERLGAARTQHNSGHGLGLSIVQAIANAHRAELIADARPEGGLEIEIRFPEVPPAATMQKSWRHSSWLRSARGQNPT